MSEPGLDLHEWETRWSALEDAARDSPAEAVDEMDRLLEEMLHERGLSFEPVLSESEEPEAIAQFRAARELARVPGGGDRDPGDVAAAIEAYRELYEHLVTEYPVP
jgi:hypothetical protein